MNAAADNQKEKIKENKSRNLLRRLYDWVLHWAETPYGVPALFVLAFAESSFFPIPPDVLLIALALSIPKKSFRFAAICLVGSVAGGCLGYVFGILLREPFEELFRCLGHFQAYENVLASYKDYGALYTFAAAFTPIPYKVFTIGAGVAQINFPVFLGASIIGRAGRFFAVGALIYFFGARVKNFIDRYFNLLTIVFTVILVGCFILLKFVF